MAQRFEGRNLEDALDNAARGLGVERYQVSYHVVVERRGFLGGVKRVVIEATPDLAATRPQDVETSSSPEPGNELVPPRRERAAREPRARERGGRRSSSGGGGRRREHDAPRHHDSDRRGPRRDFAPAFDDEIPAQGEESKDALAVRTWCEELIDLAGLELVVRTSESEEQIDVRFFGRDGSRLIDRDGELLDSIQVIANKSLVGRGVEKPVEIDARGFKEERTAELRARAIAAASRVRRDGQEQLLAPMTPVERRIVHLALQDDPDVATESRGDGFLKRVAIIPRAGQDPAAEQ
ncbi:MAG: Jag family protein [Thermoanaerobaculia bacterium]